MPPTLLSKGDTEALDPSDKIKVRVTINIKNANEIWLIEKKSYMKEIHVRQGAIRVYFNVATTRFVEDGEIGVGL